MSSGREKALLVKADFANGSIPLRRVGDVAVLVRDAARILRVALQSAKVAVALPWDSSLFALAVNGVLYESAPVTLTVGDEMQLCEPGSWSDEAYTFTLAEDEEEELAEETGASADNEEPTDTGVVPSASADVGQRLDGRDEVQRGFAKWSNFYAYRYNDLTRCRREIVPLVTQGDPGVDRTCQSSCGGGCSHVLVTHIEDETCWCGSGGPCSYQDVERSSPQTPSSPCGGCVQSYGRCCACPLWQDSLGGHDMATGRKVEQSAWSLYAAPYLAAGERLRQEQKRLAAAAASDAAKANGSTRPHEAELTAVLQRMRQLEEMLAGTRYR